MKLSNPLRHPFRVPRVEKPGAEGRFHLPDGRRLGYAEFGDPAGAVVLWFHGTLGARRQFPLAGRRAAEKLGLRVVVVERPGSGLSDAHRYHAVVDWAADMAEVSDQLGAERLGVVGLSGGGPYALACGAIPPLVARVAAVAVLDGVVPSVGPDATAGGVVEVARRFAPVLSGLRRPLGALSTALAAPLIPVAHYAYRGYAGFWPPEDRRVLADPEIEAIFVDDMLNVIHGRFQGMIDDVRLFGRDWGFRLTDVKVPVRWWHGDADPLVPLAAVEAAVSRLQDAELTRRCGESHLGGFASIGQVLQFLRAFL
ncbi:MAG: alpha/beta hydrolase [Mycobacterium sp.]|uniref:alpha/beta fold hydrolase n=1 Tax=Mycobacterium sp. TaxID=1785 RepID=UPI002618DE3B|nr:alpha/beta hydrolase [Mycobacterium sp.]MDI3313607.1 alpha/beta hydrolase [Mycobacterium sp.]